MITYTKDYICVKIAKVELGSTFFGFKTCQSIQRGKVKTSI